ncbi:MULTISPECIES: hypothetical protein [Streptomyces]|uniref:hypothetical protein n=1 Tax=Streptomyces TaxID=1883 RepID=UPI001965CD5E|nr:MULTISPECIES: hypothetical protein [Streptomyces]QRX94949.1 hypothetical protein JNO44_32715 [Streptomyces noursei]UJB39517.1 hypothetical protein HRD51_00120 [Streptomyces sp. A1-5]UJB46253.1 hypothetical protein HRD51_40980 [Streptomyces sp. A1-5]
MASPTLKLLTIAAATVLAAGLTTGSAMAVEHGRIACGGQPAIQVWNNDGEHCFQSEKDVYITDVVTVCRVNGVDNGAYQWKENPDVPTPHTKYLDDLCDNYSGVPGNTTVVWVGVQV